ncbi:MAG: hypothetical protein GX490_06915 [Bacilli bacterium]|nr:hypothetical protein [Bacilli bacterium]
MKIKIKFKDYFWALDGLGALLMLVAFVLMLIYKDEVNDLVVRLTGIGVLFFTLMRIKPILANRHEKDYLLVMFSEMLIFLVVGALLLFMAPKLLEAGDKDIFTYSRLVGLLLWIRGIVHFWTTAKRYELHDVIGFIVNVLFISFGFLFLLTNKLTSEKIALFLIIISLLLVAFFSYRTYNGYNNFRIQKVNALKMQDYLEKKEEEKEVIEDPKKIEDQINPKVIEEPEEKRPSLDIN